MWRVKVDARAKVWPEPSVCGQRHTVDALGSQGLERERQGRNAVLGRRGRLVLQHRPRRATVDKALYHGAEITRLAKVQEARVSVLPRLPSKQWSRLGVAALTSAPSVVLGLHALLRSCYGRIRQLPIAGVRFFLLDLRKLFPSRCILGVAEVLDAVPSELPRQRRLIGLLVAAGASPLLKPKTGEPSGSISCTRCGCRAACVASSLAFAMAPSLASLYSRQHAGFSRRPREFVSAPSQVCLWTTQAVQRASAIA
jgi:hypothetical protein